SNCLYQIFENLLSNAVKFSKNGGGIAFNVRYEEETLHATIQDAGTGIGKSAQDQTFDRFFMAKNVGIIEGSGLGLAIVMKCVDLTSGEISFESEVGKGTTFKVAIPVQKAK